MLCYSNGTDKNAVDAIQLSASWTRELIAVSLISRRSQISTGRRLDLQCFCLLT